MGTQLSSPKKGQSPQFLAHVYCCQTAGWIKTPLGTEVDLGPGHFVLDGFPAIAGRGTAAPLFGPCLLWPRSPISATAELVIFWAHQHKAADLQIKLTKINMVATVSYSVTILL